MPSNPNEDALNEFINRELETMDIFLLAKARRSYITLQAYIESRLAQGATREAIREALLTDLRDGGPIFAEFRNAIRATSNGVINRLRDGASYSDWGVDTQYRWAAVLVNTCPDCLERHGESKTWDEWEAEGLPRTGATVCKENCKCMLIPASDTVLEPIRRNLN